MLPRADYDLPPDKEPLAARAVRLEWWSIFFLATITVAVYLSAGSSQAMKVAWIEDGLSLVPPAAYLVATRYRGRTPDRRFPYGYHRAISIAFLCASVTLVGVGGFLLVDSLIALIARERPELDTVTILGRSVWQGWPMMATLVYGAIPPFVLGRKKLPIARAIHDKALYADAKMNKGDVLTSLAGILGVAGMGIGWWWADGVAGGIMSIEILRDGGKNLGRVIGDLMDRSPRTVEGKPDPMPCRVLEAIETLPWVERATLRLREEGHVLTGEAFVVVAPGTSTIERLPEIARIAREVDWRVYELVVMPVVALGGVDPPPALPTVSREGG